MVLPYMSPIWEKKNTENIEIDGQKSKGEEDDKSAGDELKDGGYSGGRVLMEEVRPEAHQGLSLPTVINLN